MEVPKLHSKTTSYTYIQTLMARKHIVATLILSFEAIPFVRPIEGGGLTVVML